MRCLITRVSLVSLSLASSALLAPASPVTASGQDGMEHTTADGPRFMLASESGPVAIDVDHTPILQRRLSLNLEGATLKQALAEISAQAGLRLTYSDDVVPLQSRVRLRAQAITVLAALTDVLLGAGVDVVFNGGSRAALVTRPVARPQAAAGSVVGRVTDAASGEATPVANAQVLVDGRGRALTDGYGVYRIDDVEPGLRSVGVTSIG